MPANELQANIAILGGGPAGYVAAIRAIQMGASVILIEKKDLGGVCMNVGCIPTKALIESARTAVTVKRSLEYGVASTLNSVFWDSAVDRKNRVVKNLTMGLAQLLQEKGVQILSGEGTVLTKHEISVSTDSGEMLVRCDKIILATGSLPLIPSIPGITLDGVITSTQALELPALPKSIVIIGAGAIGLEFASMFAAVGVKTVVLEALDRPIPNADEETVNELIKLLKRQGISFKFSSHVVKIEKDCEALSVTYESAGKTATVSGNNVLVAAGRKLNAECFQSLSLEMRNGAVLVDDHMETSVQGVYAAGDIVGGKLLAHLAYAEGRTAAENALGQEKVTNFDTVPSCIYTSPEYASVGMTEAEAVSAGIHFKKGSFSFRHNGRALTLGAREGFVKILCDQEGVIIGAHILGAEASELISELTLAISAKVNVDVLTDIIHPHPTLSEAIWEACLDAAGRSLHKA